MNRDLRRKAHDWRIVQAWIALFAMACIPVLALLSKVFPQSHLLWSVLIAAAATVTWASLFSCLAPGPRRAVPVSRENAPDPE